MDFSDRISAASAAVVTQISASSMAKPELSAESWIADLCRIVLRNTVAPTPDAKATGPELKPTS